MLHLPRSSTFLDRAVAQTAQLNDHILVFKSRIQHVKICTRTGLTQTTTHPFVRIRKTNASPRITTSTSESPSLFLDTRFLQRRTMSNSTLLASEEDCADASTKCSEFMRMEEKGGEVERESAHVPEHPAHHIFRLG